MDPTALIISLIAIRLIVWWVMSAAAEREPGPAVAEAEAALVRASWHALHMRYAAAWIGAVSAVGTDRPSAAAAATDLYRIAGHPAPIPIWVRSMREMAIVRPLVGAFLDGLGSGQSPADAWSDAVSRASPAHEDEAWTAAVARTRAQVRARVAPDDRPACSSVRLDLLAPIERDNAVLATRAPMISLWTSSLPVKRARVTAYQLAREARDVAAGRLSIGDALDPVHLAALDSLRATARRAVPPDWEAAGRLLAACAGAVTLEGAVLLLEYPCAAREDEVARPHATDGPAITWSDGFAAWALDGVGLPREAVEDPLGLTVALIRSEDRGALDRHRLLVRTYGSERYLAEAGATPDLIAGELCPVLARAMVARYGEGPYAAAAGRLVHHDLDGLGEVRRLWACSRRDDVPLLVVEVANSTPGPDGVRERVWLRVPPWVATCQEAVAWTFGVDAPEYVPVVET